MQMKELTLEMEGAHLFIGVDWWRKDYFALLWEIPRLLSSRGGDVHIALRKSKCLTYP